MVKATTEDVMRILIGVVILVVGLAVFSRMFAQPECDDMANKTASQLTDAINRAANLPRWGGEGAPPNTEPDKFISVPIRLCEPMGTVEAWTIAWTGKMPRYEIDYEHFPEAGFMAFSESYPWSGGMGQQLIFYVAMRVGMPLAIKAIKLPVAALIKTVKGIFKIPIKFYNFLKAALTTIKNNRVIRFLTSSSSTYARPKGILSRTKAWIKSFSLVRKISGWVKSRQWAIGKVAEMEGRENVKDIVTELGGLEAGDSLLVDRNGKLVFNYKSLDNLLAVNLWLDTLDDAQRAAVKEQYGIPSYYFGRLKNYVLTSRIWKGGKVQWLKAHIATPINNKIYQPLKSLAKSLRTGVRKLKAGWGAEVLDPDELKSTSKFMQDFCREDPEKCAKTLEQIYGKEFTQLEAITHVYDSATSLKKADYVIFMQKDSHLGKVLGAGHGDYLPYMIDNEWKIEDLLAKSDYWWDDADAYFKRDWLNYYERIGVSNDEAASIYNTAYAGWHNHYGRGYGAREMAGVENAFKAKYISSTLNKYPVEAAAWGDVLAGKSFVSPWRAEAWQRAKKFALFDAGRFENPFWYGPLATQRAEEGMTEYIDTDNSLVFRKEMSVSVYSLDASVRNYGVHIWRPKFSLLDRFPVGVQTLILQGTVTQHPSLYLVSPCFGTAKIWRGDHIYVEIKKCGTGDTKTANYCYADEDLLWGEKDEPSLWFWTGVFTGWVTFFHAFCAVPVPTVATQWVCAHALLLGRIATTALIGGDATWHAYEEPPKWGYWNYYKSADICNLVNIGAGVSGGGGAKTIAAKAAAYFKGGGFLVDACMWPYLIGDATCAWPNRGMTKHDLKAEPIKNWQAQCVWGAKCNFNNICEGDESVNGCCADCVSQCSSGRCTLDRMFCVQCNRGGLGDCEPENGESQEGCCDDCGCPEGYECDYNTGYCIIG